MVEELYKKPSMDFYKFLVDDIITKSGPGINPVADDVTPESDNPFGE